jgi:hypothetical protein
MSKARAVLAVLLLAAAASTAQEVASRAWQQRLHADIPLPVPMVSLDSTNPFAVPVDTPPQLLGSTPPRKLNVSGSGAAAAYVDSKGECLGAVPLELPFPGLTSAVVEELRSSRFEPARSGPTTEPSWAVVAITVSGRVKESTVVDHSFNLPDPLNPSKEKVPPPVSPSGDLRRLPATPREQLTALATPRRFNLKVPGRDTDMAVEALVHVTADGRCDRFVPLDLERGLHGWFSSFLASWRMEPAVRGGQPVDCWVVYNARIQMKLSALESTTFRTASDRSYDPNEASN